MQVGSGEDTFERNFCCLFDSDTETGDTIFTEMLVGIFALRTISHHPAAFSSQPVDEFIAQPDSGRIGVDSNDDFFQILEVRLHEAVEPGEVRIGSGRHGDDTLKSGGDGGSSIQFTLVDDAGSLPQDGVDVVGNQFGTLHHFEEFRESTKLGVDQLLPLKVVETDATFLFAGLRHKFLLFGDAQGGYDGLRDATRLHQPTLRFFGKRGFRGIKHRTLEMLRNGCRTTFASCRTLGILTLFHIIGNIEISSTMVTVAMSRVDVDT